MLQPPKRTSTGFLLSLTTPLRSPLLNLVSGVWETTEEWRAWAVEQRNLLLNELLSHSSWFSRVPRREILEPMFSPWHGVCQQGTHKVFFSPDHSFSDSELKIPEAASGTAIWILEGLIMTPTSIVPVLAYSDLNLTEAIPFFDGETVEDDEREINLDEIEPDGAAPTHIRSREWETKKFMAKERVREARLKAQIAVKMAETEEARYIRHFGELGENESHFSDYDLTDSEDESVLA